MSEEEQMQTSFLLDYVVQLCMNNDLSDITLCVENERFPAHRLILASREYFRTLMFGHFVESGAQEIRLEVRAIPFKTLLKYIYGGPILLASLNVIDVLDVLNLAHMYGFDELTGSIERHLQQKISMKTVWAILESSLRFDMASITEECLIFMDSHVSEVLLHNAFNTISQESICRILKRDTFAAPEFQIFAAVQDWIKCNRDIADDLDAVLALVRLPLMSVDHLLNSVRPSGLFRNDVIVNAIAEQNKTKKECSLNVADENHGAKVITGFDRHMLLNDNTICDGSSAYTSHNDNKIEGITVDLSRPTLINHIQILIYNRANGHHKYSIGVSVDGMQWDRVIDHTNYFCRAWQYLYFTSRNVRYIRYCAIEHSNPKIQGFGLLSLKAFHTEDVPSLYKGFVAPAYNVATTDRGARVVEGEKNHELLYSQSNSGKMIMDDIFGYISDPLSDKEIVVQFGQPYYIGSLRLLLWDAKNQKYQLSVHTSLDNLNWTMAVDMLDIVASSTSEIVVTFTHRLLTYVKIVGTHENDQKFQCVRIQCPANMETDSLAITAERKFPVSK